ncbi:MAG: hypothetical protein JSU86_13805 [Phycisphaerales bacterium]|nr:MAG: hypothetical protein JSU86_13805 [Phycisphaerales bacterium]
MSRVTFDDLSLRDYRLTERVRRLRGTYFQAMPEICVERPRLVTRAHLDNGLFEKDRITILDKARAYRYVLENREPVVWHTQAHDMDGKAIPFTDNSLLAGSTTSKFKGVPLYPEFMALSLWPELHTIQQRAQNPYYITNAEAAELNYEIYPHWLDNTLLELGRARYQDQAASGNDGRVPDFQLLQHLVFFLASKPNCISHAIPDFSRAVEQGLRNIIDEARDKASAAADESGKMFYTAVAEAMEGIVAYSRRLADRAEQLARNEADADRRKQLLDLAKIHRTVPEHPATSFREGITTIWMCWIALHLENANVGLSLGRLDQLLYPLYRRDTDAGRLTVQEAIELVCCLWLKIGDHVPTVPEAGEQLFGGTGSNQAITIGGVDSEGLDAVNDLTYVMLRATELMLLRDPNLNARYMSGVNSREYLRRMCEANVHTKATPALHNDKAVIRSLTSKGETLEQARDYGVVGCVEPNSNGRHYSNSAAILLNLTSVLELTLYNGRHRHTGLDRQISVETGDVADLASFEQFKSAFERQLRWMADNALTINNCLGRIHQDYYPTPILSALFEGPMEKGKDVIEGGAAVNSSGVAIIGLADVADSLSAIQQAVFEENYVTFAELLDALEHNFKGRDVLHAQLVNPDKTPKYGNEDSKADANVAWVMRLLDQVFSEKNNYRGGGYRVGYWTMTNHAGFGKLTRALPNGRKDHENFASGITPVSGATPYLTKTLNSIASVPVECATNGMALNIKFTPEGRGEDAEAKMVDQFAAVVQGYFDETDGRRGGMEIQFNVTTHDTFVDAVDHPERHRELLVRVSGYTAYFKDLNPQMQKEIIDRTEYSLAKGTSVPYEPFRLRSVRR